MSDYGLGNIRLFTTFLNAQIYQLKLLVAGVN